MFSNQFVQGEVVQMSFFLDFFFAILNISYMGVSCLSCRGLLFCRILPTLRWNLPHWNIWYFFRNIHHTTSNNFTSYFAYSFVKYDYHLIQWREIIIMSCILLRQYVSVFEMLCYILCAIFVC